jgi:hypothetical protein
MTCQFCYDRPLVRATGHNGELVPMVCPVCGTGEASGSANDGRASHGAKAKTGRRKGAGGAGA